MYASNAWVLPIHKIFKLEICAFFSTWNIFIDTMNIIKKIIIIFLLKQLFYKIIINLCFDYGKTKNKI